MHVRSINCLLIIIAAVARAFTTPSPTTIDTTAYCYCQYDFYYWNTFQQILDHAMLLLLQLRTFFCLLLFMPFFLFHCFLCLCLPVLRLWMQYCWYYSTFTIATVTQLTHIAFLKFIFISNSNLSRPSKSRSCVILYRRYSSLVFNL